MKINEQMKRTMILITFTAALIVLVQNIIPIAIFLIKFIVVLKPVIYGAIFAFIFNILLVHVEKPLKKKMKNPRGLSIILTLAIFILILYAVFTLVLPQIFDSLMSLVRSLPGYWENTKGLILDFAMKFNITEDKIINLPWVEWLKFANDFIWGVFPSIFSSAGAITSSIANIFLGMIMSIYMLANKETLLFQIKKVIYCIFSKKASEKVIEIGKLSNKILHKFASGQLLEALILGTLCFIGMMALRLPYAPLIAVIIGITNIIPIFGPIIGTIPATFLILMINPMSALVFIIFILILQQIDSNIIYPRVVGESVSLPAMWIMLAILVGGGMFGLAGMLLGVPTVAIIYSVLRDIVNKKYYSKTHD